MRQDLHSRVRTLVAASLLASTVVSDAVARPLTASPAAAARILSIRPGAGTSRETLVVRSPRLGTDRVVWVELPAGYEHSTTPFPLLLVLDAEWLFDLVAAHQRYYSLDEVTDVKIPPAIVVGLPNDDRDRDYTPTKSSGNELHFPTAGSADAFLRFLEEELIPLLADRYRTNGGRTIIGWSFSGLFSAYAAARRPALFAAHLCISPALWWDHQRVVDEVLAVAIDRPKRMVFTLGAGEAGGMVYESTRRLLSELRAHPVPGLSVSDFELEGVGHTWGVAAAIDRGLQALSSGYIAPDKVVDDGQQAIEAYYAELSRQWGYPVQPPGKVLLAAADRELSEGRSLEALALLESAHALPADDALIEHKIGTIFAARGATGEAARHFERAIERELQKPVPNEGNLRQFRDALADLGKDDSAPNR